MQLSDVKRIEYKGKIKILPELGIPLGFEDGSQVYFSPFTKKGEAVVIVTSINPECWEYLYNIRFNLGDEPGSLAAIATILESEKINILISVSVTTLPGNEAEWRILADFRKFNGNIKELNRIIRKKVEEDINLRNKIKVINKEKCINRELLKDKEILYVDGLEAKFKKYKLKNGWEGIKISGISPAVGMVKKGYIKLPRNIINGLRKHFKGKFPEATILVANVDENTLNLSFPSPDEKILKIKFSDLKDDIGVIKYISNLLAGWKINLRNTKSNILVWDDKGEWEIFININKSLFKRPFEIKRKILEEEKGKKKEDRIIRKIKIERLYGIRGKELLKPSNWGIKIYLSLVLFIICLVGAIILFKLEIPIESRNLIEFLRVFGTVVTVISFFYLTFKIAKGE